jgi:hypothetical protein
MFFIFFVQQKRISLYANTYFSGEFDENPNHMKISKSWNFQEKGCKGTNFSLKHLDDYLYWLCSKILTPYKCHMYKK